MGGKLEQGESSLQAMIRECQEETGLEVRQWETLGNLTFPGGGVDVYYAACDLTWLTKLPMRSWLWSTWQRL